MRGSVGGGQNVSYYFSLGNVGGFERKLEQAQEELGVAPREYLPVTYEAETSWAGELLKLAPMRVLVNLAWVSATEAEREEARANPGQGELRRRLAAC